MDRQLYSDGIVFINGIPVVVLEFKSAVKRIQHICGYVLTHRYRRDIPELLNIMLYRYKRWSK